MPFADCSPMLMNVVLMNWSGPSVSPGSGVPRMQTVLVCTPQNCCVQEAERHLIDLLFLLHVPVVDGDLDIRTSASTPRRDSASRTLPVSGSDCLKRSGCSPSKRSTPGYPRSRAYRRRTATPGMRRARSARSDGARKPVPHDARNARLSMGAQRTATFGFVELPESL